MQKIESQIVIPTIQGLKNDNIEYKGFVFIGLIKVGDNPFVIEYNVRMGDPETEVVIPRIKSDLVALFEAVASEKLIDINLDVDSKTAATIVVVSGGYPEEFEKGKEIFGLDTKTESLIFHAGTKEENGKIVSNGGRVLAVTSFGDTFSTATKKSYQTIENLKFDKMNYRKDIGFDL